MGLARQSPCWDPIALWTVSSLGLSTGGRKQVLGGFHIFITEAGEKWHLCHQDPLAWAACHKDFFALFRVPYSV